MDYKNLSLSKYVYVLISSLSGSNELNICAMQPVIIVNILTDKETYHYLIISHLLAVIRNKKLKTMTTLHHDEIIEDKVL